MSVLVCRAVTLDLPQDDLAWAVRRAAEARLSLSQFVATVLQERRRIEALASDSHDLDELRAQLAAARSP